jgi:hypothetical protein
MLMSRLGGDSPPNWLFVLALIGLIILASVAVSECNIDNVYTTENNGTFVWRMTNRECERNVCAAHVNRGAFWIEAK